MSNENDGGRQQIKSDIIVGQFTVPSIGTLLFSLESDEAIA